MEWSDPQEASTDSQQGLQDVTYWGLFVPHLLPLCESQTLPVDSGRYYAPTSLRAFAHAGNSLPHVVIFRVCICCPRVFTYEDEVKAYFSLVSPGSGQAGMEQGLPFSWEGMSE